MKNKLLFANIVSNQTAHPKTNQFDMFKCLFLASCMKLDSRLNGFKRCFS